MFGGPFWALFFLLEAVVVDRFALFVDAGYLYAATGHRYFGTKLRHRLRLDFQKFTEELVTVATSHSRMQYLRTYWYDAAVGGIATPTQRALSFQRGVKLRLGRLAGRPRRQKGVDSRIVRDLITLSLNGALTNAYLLSGDDDLSEGVMEAQERGTHVTLLGVAPVPGEQNQSQRLVQQTDDFVLLDEEMIKTCFTLLPETDPVYRAVTIDEARELGTTFAADWIVVALPADIQEVLAGKRPFLPFTVNGRLVRWAEQEIGTLRTRDELKIALREGFWNGLEATDVV